MFWSNIVNNITNLNSANNGINSINNNNNVNNSNINNRRIDNYSNQTCFNNQLKQQIIVMYFKLNIVQHLRMVLKWLI